jgi:drug/metabolite transporter (DMT)-like permease
VLALVVAAFLFGATFVVVKSALDGIEPLAFVAWRFLIAAVILATLALPKGRTIWRHGTVVGTALFAGFSLQTAGLQHTSASNSALIGVAAGWVLLGERLGVAGWVGTGLIVTAIYVVVTNQRDPASREAEAVTVAH